MPQGKPTNKQINKFGDEITILKEPKIIMIGIYNHRETRTPIYTKERNDKISRARIGIKLSEETKKRMGESHKGRKYASRKIRISLSEEHKKKIGLALIGKYKGEKSHLWQGGKSFEPYTLDWTNTLRRSIRERDDYVCSLCKRLQGDEVFDVHHIDYDKKNCNPNNLITLCRSCHVKTNTNRDDWKNYFIKYNCQK